MANMAQISTYRRYNHLGIETEETAKPEAVDVPSRLFLPRKNPGAKIWMFEKRKEVPIRKTV